jgi:hypothetical protein
LGYVFRSYFGGGAGWPEWIIWRTSWEVTCGLDFCVF